MVEAPNVIKMGSLLTMDSSVIHFKRPNHFIHYIHATEYKFFHKTPNATL